MTRSYPLGKHDDLRAASGRRLAEITLEAAAQAGLDAADIQVSPDTLRAQAEIARQAGFTQLAANLIRAAELTTVPDHELLQMYEMLRPGRSSADALEQLAQHLEQTYQAHETARMVREAALAYQTRGLLRR